jgi:hypothetical protein
LLELVVELLQEATEGAHIGGGASALALKSAIAAAEATEGVDDAMLEEARVLLVPQMLRLAMEKRHVPMLHAALATAATAEGVDAALIQEAKTILVDETLLVSIKFDPLERLRTSLNSSPAAGAVVLDEAHARIKVLATADLERVMLRRQLEPLCAAIATADEERVVDAAMLDRAHAMVPLLEAEPQRAEPAPPGAHGVDELERPTHIDDGLLSTLTAYADKTTTATHDYKYWGGDPRPWRNGDNTPITDPDVILAEEEHKLAAEMEDDLETAGTEGHATKKRPDHALKLRCCGIRIDFLLALTFALGMWDWKTWEVVQYLVKPATEAEGRCRFAELPCVRPFAGAATLFVSHCW